MHNQVFADLRDLLAKNLGHVNSTLRVGSLFSGWGVLEMVCQDLQKCWNSVQPSGSSLEAQFILDLRNPSDFFMFGYLLMESEIILHIS